MFIELTDKQTGLPVSINTNHIITVWKRNNNCGIDTVAHNFGMQLITQESYEEVKAMIQLQEGLDE